MIKAIINAQIVLDDSTRKGTILIENERIIAVGTVIPPEHAEIIDARDYFAGPGFVDIHCHGGGDASSHLNPAKAAEHHLASGTTSLLLSLGYSLSKEEFHQGIQFIREAISGPPKNLFGIHFEGPYINPKYGASSDKAWIMNREDYVGLFHAAKGLVYQCTYAPEMPGARTFAKYVREQGVALAVGHTEMSPAVLAEAMEDGTTIVTHLYDAMGCYLGPESISCTGIIQDTAADAALAQEGLFIEMICDSRAIHVKPSNLKVAFRTAGPDYIVLITDATVRPHHAEQYPEGDIRSTPDLNFNEKGELSGSRLTMEQAVKNMKYYTGATIPELFKMASTNPARAVGVDNQVGTLEPGKLANIILCDEKMDVKAVYFRGEQVKRKD